MCQGLGKHIGYRTPECCFLHWSRRGPAWKQPLQLRDTTRQECGLWWRDMADPHDHWGSGGVGVWGVVRGINIPTVLSACLPASGSALHWRTQPTAGPRRGLWTPPGRAGSRGHGAGQRVDLKGARVLQHHMDYACFLITSHSVPCHQQ